MALAEEKILAAVEIILEQGLISVKWLNRIKRGETVISEIPHRRVFAQQEKEEFLLEVEGGEAYTSLLGW